MKDTAYWINHLNLQAHPEGGYYRETYRSDEIIAMAALPNRFSGDRNFSTGIYFLLDKANISAFHRIKQDEIWHYYDGSSLSIHIINADGQYCVKKLGINIEENEEPQVIVPAASYFAAEVNNKTSFTLCGCTVAPGFDFADFEMPNKQTMIKLFPNQLSLIKIFTRL
ncbi:MAG: hypothetical protein A2Y40_08275 [Candidatus Margulisbacteria bacterium GWF2_35_9]|nr:MAG: hypothetical protein A2Y40_08275 [Candidatus Margulisbacteria bacterium GWF2_35_9]